MKTHRNMNNQEIAWLLRAVSAAYEVKGENRFKIIAYDRAAAAVEHATSEIKDLWDDAKLTSLAGIGPSIASHLDELFRTGKVRHFEQVVKGLPPAMFEMLFLPGVGAKTAFKLCQALGIRKAKTALIQLEKAAQKGRIASIEGFGEKSQAEILETLQFFRKNKAEKKRMTLPYADGIARELMEYLDECPAALKVNSLGSLRRMAATVGDVDLAVATKKPKELIDWFLSYPRKDKIIERGPAGSSIRLQSGHQIDLRVQKPEAYGAMLQYFTGSKQHNIHLRELALKKGYSLSEHGIKKFKGLRVEGFKDSRQKLAHLSGQAKVKKFKDEEGLYHFLGLEWIPPELREDTGEIEAALLRQSADQGKLPGLPKLVELKDIKGDLHVHSDFPLESSHDEGESSVETLVKKAIALGYEYLGLSEHNPSRSQHTDGQIIDLLKQKKDKVDELRYSLSKDTQKKDLRLINGLEIDIRPNGELAVPEKALDFLDYAIASVHSSFRLTRKEMTERILKALRHPKVKILGHPTGRKLGQREGCELDWDQIFAFCQKHHKWLEINAWPDRLDLPDTLVREAVKNGVKMTINTDAHQVDHLELMFYGVAVAKRGWAEKKDIVNTLGYGKIKELF